MVKSVQVVRRWGTSRAVVITKRVQKRLTWPLREIVHVTVENDAIVLRPVTFTIGSSKPPAEPVSESVA